MNWKKILALAFFLAAARRGDRLGRAAGKRQRPAAEGTLLDIPGGAVERIELRNGSGRFVFIRRDTLWYLEQPLAARADKVALESILDNFCQLKYDRLVAEESRDLKTFGLDEPGIELKLFAAGKPAATVLLGVKNSLDDSSYAKLATGGKVVSLAAYKRNDLEKDLFAFRDKKFLEIDTMAVSALDFRCGENRLGPGQERRALVPGKARLFPGQRRQGRRSPRCRLDAGSPVVRSGRRRAAAVRPRQAAAHGRVPRQRRLAPARGREKRRAGFRPGRRRRRDIRPSPPVSWKSSPATLPPGAKKKWPCSTPMTSASFRSARGLSSSRCARMPPATGGSRRPLPGRRPGAEKIDALLTALADLEAGEFIDAPGALPAVATRIVLKTEDPADPGQSRRDRDGIRRRRWGDGHRAQPGAALCLQGRQGDTGEISRETSKTSPRKARPSRRPGNKAPGKIQKVEFN